VGVPHGNPLAERVFLFIASFDPPVVSHYVHLLRRAVPRLPVAPVRRRHRRARGGTRKRPPPTGRPFPQCPCRARAPALRLPSGVPYCPWSKEYASLPSKRYKFSSLIHSRPAPSMRPKSARMSWWATVPEPLEPWKRQRQ